MNRIAQGGDVLLRAINSLGTLVPGMRELSRKNYNSNSTHYSANKLDNAFDKHLDDIKPGAQLAYDVNEVTPKGDLLDRLHSVLKNGTDYAGSSFVGNNEPFININPKAGREFYAHELGHLASQQTDVGRAAAALRANPKLAKALGVAAVASGAGTVATLNDGNNEYDEAALIGLASTIPTLADEALATRHGLAMMDKAGMRATLGQRGKLASSLLSYATPGIVAALIGTGAGNLLEYGGDQMAG